MPKSIQTATTQPTHNERITDVEQALNNLPADTQAVIHCKIDELKELITFDDFDTFDTIADIKDYIESESDSFSLVDDYSDDDYEKALQLAWEFFDYLTAIEDTDNTSEPSQATLIPLYSVYRNGKPFYTTGSISTAYPKPLAENIINLLNQVADDDYSLQLITWSDLKSEQEFFYQVLRNGEVMRTNKNSISEAYTHRHAVDIVHYLNKVSDDNFSLKLSNLGESGTGKVTSFIDTWEGK